MEDWEAEKLYQEEVPEKAGAGQRAERKEASVGKEAEEVKAGWEVKAAVGTAFHSQRNRDQIDKDQPSPRHPIHQLPRRHPRNRHCLPSQLFPLAEWLRTCSSIKPVAERAEGLVAIRAAVEGELQGWEG